jgi:hypothetical protein
MLTLDIVGLVVTVCLIGLRYPLHVLGASLINGLGQVLMILFLHGHIESVVAAGAFGSTVVSGVKSGAPALLVIFAGSLSNYIVSSAAGGIEYEKTRHILNPLSPAKFPFAVVNLRLALLTFLLQLWQVI